jgi:2-C-methyl-D-erythritol 4-phosphate cytidylyltransferase
LAADLDAITDEASAMEACGLRARVVKGSEGNRKMTTAEDLAWLRQLQYSGESG